MPSAFKYAINSGLNGKIVDLNVCDLNFGNQELNEQLFISRHVLWMNPIACSSLSICVIVIVKKNVNVQYAKPKNLFFLFFFTDKNEHFKAQKSW